MKIIVIQTEFFTVEQVSAWLDLSIPSAAFSALEL